MKLKTGKDEIVYLLTRVFIKYEQSTGHELVKNTNRKNYEGLARVLSQISNELPNTAATLNHEEYSPDRNGQKSDYPYRKYDITGGQIKDAYNGIVSNPRQFMVDSCYIYLFGVGRKGFEEDPQDPQLLYDHASPKVIHLTDQHKAAPMWVKPAIGILLAAVAALLFLWVSTNRNFQTLKKDLNISPYTPTSADISKLEGIWMVYIGSPQARISDSNRYHQVVTNIIDVKYVNGYFLFNRYGASFDHTGYMQYENAYVVSIHSYVKNNSGKIESPRLSLMRLDKEKNDISVISSSWNFDVGERNDVIGIREVYHKLANSGEVEEVMNTVENSSCRCKIVSLESKGTTHKFYLRNETIDSLKDNRLKTLIDEHSILLREPKQGVILSGEKPKL